MNEKEYLSAFCLKGKATEVVEPCLGNAALYRLDYELLSVLVLDLCCCGVCVIVLNLNKARALAICKAYKYTVISAPVCCIVLECKEVTSAPVVSDCITEGQPL